MTSFARKVRDLLPSHAAITFACESFSLPGYPSLIRCFKIEEVLGLLRVVIILYGEPVEFNVLRGCDGAVRRYSVQVKEGL